VGARSVLAYLLAHAEPAQKAQEWGHENDHAGEREQQTLDELDAVFSH
jgi:hypothetical protein